MLEERKASLSFCVNKKIVYQALCACRCVGQNVCVHVGEFVFVRENGRRLTRK